jgi:hypothetical protein
MKKNLLYILLPLAFTIALSSCDEDEEIYSPKPRGYARIKFPEKKYRMLDTACPYKLEIPVYASINPDRHKNAEPCWINLDFTQFRATLHISYKTGNKVKATGLEETVVLRDSAKVYGLLFDIAGNTASSLQFYLTDSTHHFLRGALYFNAKPNIDSLKIVVDFIREDVLHLINTAKWKD